jgi:inner membrane transporter RhtA
LSNPRDARVSRRGVGLAAGYVAIGSIGIQISSAVAAQVFAVTGPMGASAMRYAIGALALLAIFRPNPRTRSKRRWGTIILYGASLAAMTMCLYTAIDRLPLGVAVTLEFLGPCAVALAHSRRAVDAVCALAALAGVALIAGPAGAFDLLGYAAGLGAAAMFALYTILTARLGDSDGGLGDLALAVAVAAVLAAPLLPRAADAYTGRTLALVTASALLGLVITYTVDMLAARASSARVVGTLFSIDPVMGLLVGWLALDQQVPWTGVVGVAMVAGAGALLAWSARPADAA